VAIRNKHPQAYNNITKQNEEVIWPSSSVDFDDGDNLQKKMKELLKSVNELKNRDNELLDIIHVPVPIP
jgi:apolipoprotein N-acyltransferase